MKIQIILFFALLWSTTIFASTNKIPLPEHPRPEFQRIEWRNLNGSWDFEFDAEDNGLAEKWFEGSKKFSKEINVPFPWGSKLSGVKDEAVIAWYERLVVIPNDWKGKRVFLMIGASDWHTTGWLDGSEVGQFKGGYTPIEFELTDIIKWGEEQTLFLRVDDTEHEFKLYGKQGYGDCRGIWQTVYLEARSNTYFESIHFSPDIDKSQVNVVARLNAKPEQGGVVEIHFKNTKVPAKSSAFEKGVQEIEFTIDLPDQHLWSLDDPFLYDIEAYLKIGQEFDKVSSYFGQRKISIMEFPGEKYTYVALNNKPVYLQLALDQAYHPDGFYTYPSDDYMRDEILRTRQLGLNGQRIHVKIENPRKLYWADKLGVLIMADIPNSWGEPDTDMQRETETALRGMIKRDFNHPSIFSWVVFNETWGLFSKESDKKRVYKKETQKWVEAMYKLTKNLDPTRLVEDNSPCNYDHVDTDLNTWHAYLPGYSWKEFLDNASAKTFKHSSWNFVKGKSQKKQPNINSECGNVWGYNGSTGDVDWSWDYHCMMNEFRRHPKIAGWLYTEHHDVINEWNGYYKFDRSLKFTGFEELYPGMSIKDLHSEFYISTGQEICRTAVPGEVVNVPIYASFMSDLDVGETLLLEIELFGWDDLGVFENFGQKLISVPCEPWLNREFEPVSLKMPEKNAVVIMGLKLKDATGTVLQQNFASFIVSSSESPRQEIRMEKNRKLKLVRFAPLSFSESKWSEKQWDVFSGLKVNAAGSGYFEYRLKWPDDVDAAKISTATLKFEASAKQLFGKDKGVKIGDDYMRGKGTFDNSANKNSYPMTDEERYSSSVQVIVNGHSAGIFDLPDDPADSRGILSWHSQKRDRTLNEAGSYGYLVSAKLPEEALQAAFNQGELLITLKTPDALPHGLAIYGEKFGRYLLDPTLIFEMKYN
jgi:hypothetical protein